MKTRRALMLALVAGLVLGHGAGAHVPGTSHSTPEHEASLAIVAALSSIVYFPVKVAAASVGLVGGAVVGLVTGGETRAAYAVWVPMAGGNYVVRPAHLDGTRPFAFFGSVYEDRPSRHNQDGSIIYDSLYSSRYERDPRTED
jgi:hypothetical protein